MSDRLYYLWVLCKECAGDVFSFIYLFLCPDPHNTVILISEFGICCLDGHLLVPHTTAVTKKHLRKQVFFGQKLHCKRDDVFYKVRAEMLQAGPVSAVSHSVNCLLSQCVRGRLWYSRCELLQ